MAPNIVHPSLSLPPLPFRETTERQMITPIFDHENQTPSWSTTNGWKDKQAYSYAPAARPTYLQEHPRRQSSARTTTGTTSSDQEPSNITRADTAAVATSFSSSETAGQSSQQASFFTDSGPSFASSNTTVSFPSASGSEPYQTWWADVTDSWINEAANIRSPVDLFGDMLSKQKTAQGIPRLSRSCPAGVLPETRSPEQSHAPLGPWQVAENDTDVHTTGLEALTAGAAWDLTSAKPFQGVREPNSYQQQERLHQQYSVPQGKQMWPGYHSSSVSKDHHDQESSNSRSLAQGHNASGRLFPAPIQQLSTYGMEEQGNSQFVDYGPQGKLDHEQMREGCTSRTVSNSGTPAKTEASKYISFDDDDSPMDSTSTEPTETETEAWTMTLEQENALLLRLRRQGVSFPDIKKIGRFTVTESTLRGRYRTLTKMPHERPRKPKSRWSNEDTILLVEAMCIWSPGCMTNSADMSARVPWKKVAEYIFYRSGFMYGPITVKQQWGEYAARYLPRQRQISTLPQAMS